MTAPIYIDGAIINNNAADSVTDISELTFYNSTWKPRTGEELNNVDSIEFLYGNLYSDNLLGYTGNLVLLRPYLFHNEGVSKFETYILPQNTELVGCYLDYSLDDKAYDMAMHDDILFFQKGSEVPLIKIEEGGNGKFGYQYFVIGGQPFLFNQSYDFTGRTYETPDKVATIYYDVTLDPFENSNELALYFKLHSINIKDEKYFSLIGNIGSESEYIDLEGGFTGDGGLNLVAETDENGIVDTEIYLGGDANTYTGATIVNSGVTLHLESADTISASTELKLYGNASFVVDDSTGTGNEFTNFNKVTLVGTSSTGADGATQTQISGGGSAIKA